MTRSLGESQAFDHTGGLTHDHTVRTMTRQARRDYPGNLRRVHYYDAVHDNDLQFLTNHKALAAITVADIYRLRWTYCGPLLDAFQNGWDCDQNPRKLMSKY